MDALVKDPVYVTGHQNPDTDSIVSAIAYAALRNALGDREYVAARLGNVSDETQRVLDKFDAEPPVLLSNVRTQVRDLVFDTPPAMARSVTIAHAWETMKTGDGAPSVIPIVEDDGTLYGMMTSGDIANHSMKNVDAPHVDNVPVFNLLSVLEGQIVNQPASIPEELSGDVIIAVPTAHEGMLFNNPNSIVVCGQQADMVRHALEVGVKAVVICQADVSEEFRSNTSDTLIITSPLSAYRTARMINLALPVERICATENLKVFHLDDYLDDVKDVLLNSRYRAYPILDEDDKVVGTMGRYHMIRPKRKRVVLVDHNELSQTVPGLAEAELLGIIDHHRLADIQSTAPIFFRNEILGSTATIISEMYQEKGIMPSKKIAGLLVSAIISDTVMFKSPTCTPHDKVIAERMARIAEVTLEEVGNTVFAGADLSKPVDELIFTDFKEFLIADHKLGIGQVTCLNSDELLSRQDEMLAAMKARKEDRGYDYILIMLTDVLKEGTELLYIGDDQTITNAYGQPAANNAVFLPHVMSRKKQIVPRLSELWG
ncbi:MAG: putative manganese-dependent inorganic diphosphatase [Ruminococcaceae bacterium]|nr:putative manganese-dependent inorganic diphosphatase [Oscillospiraceae bacterium]